MDVLADTRPDIFWNAVNYARDPMDGEVVKDVVEEFLGEEKK